MVIFDFEEKETGAEHVAIATSNCEPSGIFFVGCNILAKCFNSIASFLAEIFLILRPTSLIAQPRISSVTNLHNRKT